MERVSLVRGSQSYDAVKRALELITDDICVPSDKPVLIKVNMVFATLKLANTSVPSVQAVMDHLLGKGVKRFILAEGPSHDESALASFERLGYFSLRDRYDVEFRDLKEDKKVNFEVIGANREPVTVRLARSFLDHYVVSVAPMKTHLRVAATLTTKNMAIGFILDADRHPKRGGLVSHEIKDLNLSVARLAQVMEPQLAIIDGVVGMEGNGPEDGTPVKSGVVVAGRDALTVDLVGAQLMGFAPSSIGYLWYLSQLRNVSIQDIKIVGDDWSRCITKYRVPDNYPEIIDWRVKNWRKFVKVSAREKALLEV